MPTKKEFNENRAARFKLFGPTESYSIQGTHNCKTIPSRKFTGKSIGEIRYNPETKEIEHLDKE